MHTKSFNVSVENKVFLITGAFGLLGKEICNALLSSGAKVIIAGHNKKYVSDMVDFYSHSFKEDSFLVCDLDITSESSINKCLKSGLKKFNKIDVLINNAAIDSKVDSNNNAEENRFETYPLENIRKSVDVNILGTVRVTQKICKQMLKQGFGNIINVSSIYGLTAPNQQIYDFSSNKINYKPVDYIITKSFIPNYTRYLATLYAKKNIRCNAIAPGGIYNNHDSEFVKNYSQLCPLGRMANKNEFGGAFIFLASDASSYMTGSVLVVDGGWTAW